MSLLFNLLSSLVIAFLLGWSRWSFFFLMYFILFRLYWSIIALRSTGSGDRKQTPWSLHLIKRVIKMIFNHWRWPWSPSSRRCLSALSHCEVKLSFSPLYTVVFGKKSLCMDHTSGVGVMFFLLEATWSTYFKKLFWILVSFLNEFVSC